MKTVSIDESKLSEVMEIIEKAINLMESANFGLDKQANKELMVLQKELRTLTGNKKIDIKNYYGYWAYTDLETVARQALMASPQKKNLTNEQIAELVKKIGEAEFPIAEMDYWLEVLELETGLPNAADYIYCPDLVGLSLDASFEDIAKKILEDQKM